MTDISISSIPRLLNTRYGSLSAPAGTRDLITDFLEHYGEWASLEVEYLAALLPPKARVLDVGAYLGTFAIGLAQTASTAFVALVEGNATVVPYLAANAERNLRCEHEVLNALVVNSSAPPIEAGWAEADNAGSTSFSEQANGAVRVQPPDATIAFKALVDRFGPLDLIKLDVEGMEEQLLADHPSLLHDRSVLLWLECNESPSSLSLVQMLLDTERPVTYFAWPSHNPNNYRGAVRKIFPFAYEAGLLLGRDATTLNRQHQQAGCLVKSIHTVEDLREALWLTPRWAPREWDLFGRNEIAAIASHLELGKKLDSFLAKGSAATERKTKPDADLHNSIALKDARIAQLESRLAELVNRELAREWDKSISTVAISEIGNNDGGEMWARKLQEQDEIYRDRIILLEEQLLEARELHEQRGILLRDEDESHRQHVGALEKQLEEVRELCRYKDSSFANQIAALGDQVQALSTELHHIRSSLTWRIGMRLSRIAGRIPLVKPVVRRLLRHKMVGGVQP